MDDVLEVYLRENDVDTPVGPETVKLLLTDSSCHNNDSQTSLSENEAFISDSEIMKTKRKLTTDDGDEYLSDNKISPNDLENTKQKRKSTIKSDTPSKKRMYTQKYRKEWENMTMYKPWLSESVLGNLFFYCKFCKNNYKCGKTEIDKHMICKKHIRNSKVPQVRVQKKFNFRGLMCPVFTPFSGREKEVNYELIPAYAQHLKSYGVNGILINDIIGEGMTLTLPERLKLINEWAKVCEDTKQHLMVQIGGAPLKDVLEMVRYAEKKKVGSVAILPDLYNKPKDHFDLMRYIKLVTDQANTIPLLYHHNPSYTGVNIDMTKFLNDILGEIDSFIGVIFSDNNLKDATSALQVNEDKFIVFMGTNEVLLGSSVNGFNSFVSSSLNFVPKLAHRIVEKAQVGEIVEARNDQKLLLNTLESIYRYGDWLPTMKAAMNVLSKIEVGLVRDPLVPIWQDKVNKMKQDLHHLKVL